MDYYWCIGYCWLYSLLVNTMVWIKLDEGVGKQWGNVENQYQRRSDLIPNLVATVKGCCSRKRYWKMLLLQGVHASNS